MTAILTDNIKRLGLREFQRAMYEHIRQPEPIILEKFKKPHLVLLPYKDYVKLRQASTPTMQQVSPFTLSKTEYTHFYPTFWQQFKKFLNTKLF